MTPFEIGDWVHCPKTGDTGRVVRVDVRSGCTPDNKAMQQTGVQWPVYFYMVDVDGTQKYFGPKSLEKQETTMQDVALPKTVDDGGSQPLPGSDNPLLTPAERAQDEPTKAEVDALLGFFDARTASPWAAPCHASTFHTVNYRRVVAENAKLHEDLTFEKARREKAERKLAELNRNSRRITGDTPARRHVPMTQSEREREAVQIALLALWRLAYLENDIPQWREALEYYTEDIATMTKQPTRTINAMDEATGAMGLVNAREQKKPVYAPPKRNEPTKPAA